MGGCIWCHLCDLRSPCQAKDGKPCQGLYSLFLREEGNCPTAILLTSRWETYLPQSLPAVYPIGSTISKDMRWLIVAGASSLLVLSLASQQTDRTDLAERLQTGGLSCSGCLLASVLAVIIQGILGCLPASTPCRSQRPAANRRRARSRGCACPLSARKDRHALAARARVARGKC
jgi:hypothetical protein